MEVSIRPGKQSDHDQIMDLWLSGNRQAQGFVKPGFWESHREMVRDLLPKADLYVAESDDEKIAGFVGLQGRYIAGLFVEQSFRCMGIGKALLGRCKQEHSYLTLEVYAKNERAYQFYKREGFLITKAQMDREAGAMAYSMAWTSMYDALKEKMGS